jgi:hypothetical protein
LRCILPLLSQGQAYRAVYAKVRLIAGTDFKSVPARALPTDFLQSRPIFMTFKIFCEVVNV